MNSLSLCQSILDEHASLCIGLIVCCVAVIRNVVQFGILTNVYCCAEVNILLYSVFLCIETTPNNTASVDLKDACWQGNVLLRDVRCSGEVKTSMISQVRH